jgi:hypothetical protein
MGLGVYIQKAKAYNLIAGYNTLSKEEKEKFDEIPPLELKRKM